MDRRSFIKGSIFLGASIAIPEPIYASVNIITPKKYQKSLSMYNIHTQEHIQNIVFEENGIIIPEAIEQFNYLLRDRRTNEIADMDIKLFKKLYDLEQKLNTANDINVISGFRSKKTNEFLRTKSIHKSGVAKNSFHLYGQAIDLNIPNRKLSDLRMVARKMRFGGVGYYPKSQFLHLDTGRVRQWRG